MSYDCQQRNLCFRSGRNSEKRSASGVGRKGQNDGCALIHHAIQRDASAMGLHDGFAHAQPQAEPTGFASPEFVRTIEGLKNVKQVFYRDARPPIPNGNKRFPWLPFK